ncbi:MAG: ADP-ribosyltransferase [Sphingomonadaceae bacterium]
MGRDIVFTAAEQAALQYYRGSGHRMINAVLRGEEPESRLIETMVKTLDRMIARVNPFAGMHVYRGIGLEFATFLQSRGLTKGTLIHDDGFLSTSISRSVAKRFSAIGDCHIHMELRIDRPILSIDLSHLDDEAEVIFARGRTIAVLGFDSATNAIKATLQ